MSSAGEKAILTTDLSDEAIAGVRGGTGLADNPGALGMITSQQDAFAAMGAMPEPTNPSGEPHSAGDQQQNDDSRNAFITKIF
jgi:hypothetical protein